MALPLGVCAAGNPISPFEIGHDKDILPPNLQQLQCYVRREEGAVVLMGLSALTGLTLVRPMITQRESWERLAASLTQLDRLALEYR
jgi:hypothetical protein